MEGIEGFKNVHVEVKLKEIYEECKEEWEGLWKEEKERVELLRRENKRNIGEKEKVSGEGGGEGEGGCVCVCVCVFSDRFETAFFYSLTRSSVRRRRRRRSRSRRACPTDGRWRRRR